MDKENPLENYYPRDLDGNMLVLPTKREGQGKPWRKLLSKISRW
jgi:hypothetical protein